MEFQDINRASYSQSLVFGDADDEITIQVIDGDSRGKSPIRLLFPNLSDVDLTQKTSPTDITKMLVGQKPNSKYLKNAKKSRYLQVNRISGKKAEALVLYFQDLPPLVETTSDTFDNANDKAKGEK